MTRNKIQAEKKERDMKNAELIGQMSGMSFRLDSNKLLVAVFFARVWN